MKPETELIVNTLKLMATKIINEEQEEHLPMVFIPTETELVIVPLLGDFRPDFKNLITSALHLLHSDTYVLVNESWIAELSVDSPRTKKITEGEMTVSDLPLDDRQEVLMLMAVENGTCFQLYQAKINYDMSGLRQLGEWVEFPSDGIMGRLVVKEW